MSIDKKQKLSTFNRFVFEMLLPSIIMTIILIFMIRGNKKTGKYADVNGIRMYYEIYGRGKPLLFIHGNGGSIESGKDQISFFSKNHKVIAADSRGQGKTIDTDDSLTYDQLAADINALLEKLKIDSAYIIGHSDGGIVGLILAIKYPKKVKMLAAMAPNTRPDSGVLYPEPAIEMSNEMARLTQQVKQGQEDKIPKLKLTRMMVNHPNISSIELSTIQAPVLIMSGDRDVVTLSHITEIFRAIPKSQLCVLPGSTHFAPTENAKIFNETIERFFSRPFETPESF